MPVGNERVDARTLVGDKFGSVRSTIHDANPDMPEGLADRIAEEGIKSVVACARNPGAGMAPSRIADADRPAWPLHSASYAALCARFGGMVRVIHLAA